MIWPPSIAGAGKTADRVQKPQLAPRGCLRDLERPRTGLICETALRNSSQRSRVPGTLPVRASVVEQQVVAPATGKPQAHAETGKILVALR